MWAINISFVILMRSHGVYKSAGQLRGRCEWPAVVPRSANRDLHRNTMQERQSRKVLRDSAVASAVTEGSAWQLIAVAKLHPSISTSSIV